MCYDPYLVLLKKSISTFLAISKKPLCRSNFHKNQCLPISGRSERVGAGGKTQGYIVLFIVPQSVQFVKEYILQSISKYINSSMTDFPPYFTCKSIKLFQETVLDIFIDLFCIKSSVF